MGIGYLMTGKSSVIDYVPIGQEIQRLSRGEMVTLLPVDMGGYPLYAYLREVLSALGVPYVHYVLKNDDRIPRRDHVPRAEGRDDYREIIAVARRDNRHYRYYQPEDIARVVKRRTRFAFPLLHDIHHGHGAVGAIKHVLDFHEAYGVEEGGLYVVTENDGKGYAAHLAVNRDYTDSMELDTLLRILLPESYPIYEKDGCIKLIADTPTIHMPRLEAVSTDKKTGTNGILEHTALIR